ncbi:MAG: cupin domain-containing protein [Nocardioidaceae bacterium]|nr:cupin domain-containing protein [Nocardioidaceae bacterium]
MSSETSSAPTDLATFDTTLAEQGVRGFWDMLAEYEMLEPRCPELPAVWRHADYLPLAMESLTAVPIERADRRNLFFTNPGLPGSGAITSRLLGGVQAINPAERQDVHRHSASAVRVMLDGLGAFTTVEGGRNNLRYGDVVINPSGLWHESGNDGTEPIVWMDVLDLPLTKLLHANFFANKYTEDGENGIVRRTNQTLRHPDDWFSDAFAVGGVRPERLPLEPRYGSSQMLYRYATTRALLDRLAADRADPYEGTQVRYVDPRTGDPVLRTLDVRAQLLGAGTGTRRKRTTAGTLYCCLEGSGTTRAGDRELRWSARDIFVVPPWTWREHAADSADAVLVAISDEPALTQLGLHAVEVVTETGDVVRERGLV